MDSFENTWNEFIIERLGLEGGSDPIIIVFRILPIGPIKKIPRKKPNLFSTSSWTNGRYFMYNSDGLLAYGS